MATSPTMLPLRGFATLGPQDAQNPNLLPLMDIAVSSGQGTVDVMSPSRYLQNFPRADATVTCTVGGSVTNGDTVKLVFTTGAFSGGSYTTAAYPIVTADTTTTIAEQLVDLVASDANLAAHGVTAQLTGTGAATQVVLHWGGPVGNYCTVSTVVTGSATEIFTFGNSGTMAGGSGPIVPIAGFSFSYSGVLVNFQYGKLVTVGGDMLAQLVSQGRPIL